MAICRGSQQDTSNSAQQWALVKRDPMIMTTYRTPVRPKDLNKITLVPVSIILAVSSISSLLQSPSSLSYTMVASNTPSDSNKKYVKLKMDISKDIRPEPQMIWILPQGLSRSSRRDKFDQQG